MTTLRRSADDRWIAGVCGGIALVYVIAWIVMPDARTNP